MSSELDTKVINDFTDDIASKLNEAAKIASAASSLGSQGFEGRALRTLLDIEPLIADAATLLNAASIVHSRAADRIRDS